MGVKTKKFLSSMVGAPTLSGVATTLISVLDACLVNGFGITSASGLVIDAGVGTLTYGLSHPFVVDSVLRIENLNPTLNGDYRVLTATANTVTFDATGKANSTAGSPISTRIAPAGWEKVYSTPNTAGYRSLDPLSTKMVLHVDDSTTSYVTVRGLEAEGGPGFPTVSQSATGGYWSKSNLTTSAARPWIIVADSRSIFYFVKSADAAAEYQANFFGDLRNIRANDIYCCALRANVTNQSGNVAGGNFGDDLAYATSSSSYGGMFMPRPANALGGALAAYSDAVSSTGLALNWLVGASGWPFPSPIDNSLVLSPVVVYNSTGYRGYFPGLRYSTQLVSASFSTGDTVYGTGAFAGEKVMAIKLGALSGNLGLCFIDTNSDWF